MESLVGDWSGGGKKSNCEWLHGLGSRGKQEAMERRQFLIRAAKSTMAAAVLRPAWTEDVADVSADLSITENRGGKRIPLTYTGLSYEMAQLTDPSFFSASNRDLVAHFRLLSTNGVLRIGGNTSEFCWLRVTPSMPAPKMRVPANLDANWMPHRLFAIEPRAIDELAGFLEATGWRVIFGLNLGNSSAPRAAEEAALVAGKIGDRIEIFQIGNEPDFYHDANNGTRPPNWGFADYLKEWGACANAIAMRVPTARFGGPDVGASSDWVTRFGADEPNAARVRLLAMTGHYYAEGPPNDPGVTIERLLAGNPNIHAEMERIEAVARARGLVYRMTEGNSCYRGGKPGMSDAFAAALWAGDYMLELAVLGCAGVNLHGGTSAFLTAGLGGHTPGMDVAKTPQKMPSGFYTPIASEPGSQVKAMPIFYGMMLANQLAGAIPMSVTGMPWRMNATAYAAQVMGVCRMAIFNKDERQALRLSIRTQEKLRGARAWRLQAPSLDATDGVTLAGARIEEHATWHPRDVERVSVRDGIAQIQVPAGSAALLFLD